jgi:hypothetical protein
MKPCGRLSTLRRSVPPSQVWIFEPDDGGNKLFRNRTINQEDNSATDPSRDSGEIATLRIAYKTFGTGTYKSTWGEGGK